MQLSSTLWSNTLKKTLIAIAIFTLAGSAFATTTSTCNGPGACSPSTNSTTVGDNRNGQIATGGSIANGANVQAYGGQGGNGGTGGNSASTSASTSAATGGSSTATGGSVGNTSAAGGSATGGSVGNTSATGGSVGNTTSTSSSGGNSLTGGAQSQTVNTTGTVGAVSSSSGGNTVSASNGGNTLTAGAVSQSTGSVSQTVNTVDANSLEVARTNAAAARDVAREMSDIKIRNVPNVSAAALTSSNDTCMGSASGGVSGPGFGVSLGSTYKDDNCVMLKNSRELWNMGMKAAAMALMCTDSANKQALELTGYVCPQTERDNKRVSANASAQSPQYTDPIVRARMGLPALK